MGQQQELQDAPAPQVMWTKKRETLLIADDFLLANHNKDMVKKATLNKLQEQGQEPEQDLKEGRGQEDVSAPPGVQPVAQRGQEDVPAPAGVQPVAQQGQGEDAAGQLGLGPDGEDEDQGEQGEDEDHDEQGEQAQAHDHGTGRVPGVTEGAGELKAPTKQFLGWQGGRKVPVTGGTRPQRTRRQLDKFV